MNKPKHLNILALLYRLINYPFTKWSLALPVYWLAIKLPVVEKTPWLVVVIYVIIVELLAIVQYWNFTYQLTEAQLIIKQGWLNRQEHILPYGKIQAIHLRHSIWEKWLHLTHVQIETAAHGSGADVSLPAMPLADVGKIKRRLTLSGVRFPKKTFPNAANTYQISLAELAGYTATSAAGSAALGVAWTGYNRLDDILPQVTHELSHLSWVVGSLVALAIVIGGYGSIWQKNYQFSLTRITNHLKVNAGWLTQTNVTVPIKRIQGIVLTANWLRILLRKVSVKAYLSSGVKENDGTGVITLLPIILQAAIPLKLGQFVPIDDGILHLEARRRKVKLIVLRYWAGWLIVFWGAIYLANFLFKDVIALAMIGMVGSFYLITKALTMALMQKVAQTSQFLTCQIANNKGKKIAIISADKVQSVVIKQSIFMKKSHLAHLILTLRKGDKAWKIKLRYLDLAQALRIAVWVRENR